MNFRRKLTIPLALTATALFGCGQNPVVVDAASDIVADTSSVDVQTADGSPEDASCTQCTPVSDTDGGEVRYNVCHSNTMGCACVIYPDGAVVDPTFC